MNRCFRAIHTVSRLRIYIFRISALRTIWLDVPWHLRTGSENRKWRKCTRHHQYGAHFGAFFMLNSLVLIKSTYTVLLSTITVQKWKFQFCKIKKIDFNRCFSTIQTVSRLRTYIFGIISLSTIWSSVPNYLSTGSGNRKEWKCPKK